MKDNFICLNLESIKLLVLGEHEVATLLRLLFEVIFRSWTLLCTANVSADSEEIDRESLGGDLVCSYQCFLM